MLADVLELLDYADEIGDFELAESFDRQWFLLSEFYRKLEYPRGIVELLAVCASIEGITAGTGVEL